MVILVSVGAALLLLIANSAFWVNRYIFDAGKFADVAVTSITSESSRDAIATRVTNRAFEGRPIAQNLLGDTTKKLVSGLLATEQADTLFSRAVERLHVSVTSDNQESLGLDISGIKSTLQRVVTAVNPEASGERIAALPDEIQIVDKQNVPDFYRYGVFFLWLGPIAFVLSLVMLAWPHIKRMAKTSEILLWQGGTLLVLSLLSLSIGPLFKPPILSRIEESNARVVTENLYNAFIATFNEQLIVLIGLGLTTIAAGFVLHYMAVRKKQK